MHVRLVGVVVSGVLVAALVACGGTAGAGPSAGLTAASTTTTNPTSESPAVVAVEITKIVPVAGVVEPDDILLQLNWTGGMVLPYAWGGNLPLLTLFGDGILIYVGEQAMAVHLTHPEAQALVQQVLDLGFERLESYTDQCQTMADGTGMCISDATTSSMRLRLASGELRQVDNYAEFANDPDVLRAIRAFLSGYRHPAAEPYLPEKAVLYIRTSGEPEDVPVLDWPLDSALLSTTVPADTYCARVVAGTDLSALAALVGKNVGYHYFRLGNQVREVVLVPWLPGADYSAALAADGRLCSEPAATGAPTPP